MPPFSFLLRYWVSGIRYWVSANRINCLDDSYDLNGFNDFNVLNDLYDFKGFYDFNHSYDFDEPYKLMSTQK